MRACAHTTYQCIYLCLYIGEKHGHGEATTGSFDIGTGEHVSIETGVGMKFAWKSPVQGKSGLVKVSEKVSLKYMSAKVVCLLKF